MLRRNNSVQNLEFKLLALQGGWGKHFPLIKKVISWSAGAMVVGQVAAQGNKQDYVDNVGQPKSQSKS